MSPLDAARAWDLLLDLKQRGEGAWRDGQPVAPEAETLLDLYLDFALAGAAKPMTVGHLGQSLDGRIATAEGGSHYVTGPENIVHLHRMRALCDAVVVGVGTVMADDPQLTVRRVSGSDPLRVVIDPRGRMALDRRMLAGGSQGTLLLVAEDARPPDGLEAIRLPANEGRLSPARIVTALHERGLHRIFVEGGGVTVSGFLAAGVLDRLQVTVAPVLIGGGRVGLDLPRLADLADAPRPPTRHYPMGADVLFDCDLRVSGPADRGDRS